MPPVSNNLKKVSFVVINYNGGKEVIECVRSIFSQDYKDIEVILVDNNSTDNSLKQIKNIFKKIKVIPLKTNKGYAGGINEGIKKSSGEYIVVMNNDLILNKKIISEILSRKEEGDIFGVKNYFFSNPQVLWSAGVKLNRVLFRAKLVGNNKIDHGQYDLINFSHLVGSFLLIKRAVFKKIGGFDEDFFCYYEESEFQERALRNGFVTLFVPKATLLHHIAHSSGGGSNKLTDYYLVRNRGFFIQKYQNGYFKPISYFSLLTESILRAGRHISKGRFRDAFYPLMGLRDFIFEKKGKLDN